MENWQQLKENRNRKKGNFPYVRRCHTHQKIFGVPYLFRANKERTIVCDACKRHLHDIGLNIRRFYKMVENPIHINVEWENSEEGVYHSEEKLPVYDAEQNIVGTNVRKVDSKVKAEDIIENLRTHKKILSKIQQEMNDLKRQLENIGPKPESNSELERIKRHMVNIHKINEIDKIEFQLSEKQKELEHTMYWVNENEAVLAMRPDKKESI